MMHRSLSFPSHLRPIEISRDLVNTLRSQWLEIPLRSGLGSCAFGFVFVCLVRVFEYFGTKYGSRMKTSVIKSYMHTTRVFIGAASAFCRLSGDSFNILLGIV